LVWAIRGQEVKVEPFGNVRRTRSPGKPSSRRSGSPWWTCSRKRPYPGGGPNARRQHQDVKLTVEDDLLTIYAEKRVRSTARRSCCPGAIPGEDEDVVNNGILEIKCVR